METRGQTSKRAESGESEDVIKERKKRRFGGDTLQWLGKKADRDLSLRSSNLKNKEKKEQHQQQQMMLMQQMMSMMQQQQQHLQLFSSKKDKE